jgi:hypothetical protein
MMVDKEFISIYESISLEEYEEAADSTFSYFPVIVKTGEKDEDGEEIEIITYARHTYIYDDEIKSYLETGYHRGVDNIEKDT